ncbi:hypothetical protein [Acinetobacter sp. ANC 4648]|uniref:hypothetical protein n=1 Tax=Acinetobacter sp. ANC 4648 TaxID=1977875 RepID=UPI000A352B0E|nr:hypothetical protein [Acinetobacter sp. ANC 4648]OTG79409.1 hypothetical protein B9T27_14525 [Acinetobacter sp. ANC 4648]
MAKQYMALKTVGRFKSGDIVGSLTEAQITQLLVGGVIKEVEQASEPKPVVPTKITKEVKADV